MKQISILTLFPDLVQHYLSDALLARAIQQKKLNVPIVSLRDFAEGQYKTVDDVPFGGGDGMVIKADVLEKAVQSCKTPNVRVIYLSPQGKPWTSGHAKAMAESKDDVILICGRYAGVDQRFIKTSVDEEISIGDYVLSGGELASLVIVESMSRFIPGVLGHAQSATEDSFSISGLEAPQFTRPQVWKNLAVPAVLTSGHHQKISEWKSFCSYLITLKKRPDLVSHIEVDKKKLKDFYQNLTLEEKLVLDIEGLNL
ncbi:MAG: tRNA (guanosine(37)-N1)-methyltransferase TrmD [Bdellovibrio sp.]|nr:tRNA (guanosine(37)-N1)-methyltransferase TrmD [Bdellovibrio sp.]